MFLFLRLKWKELLLLLIFRCGIKGDIFKCPSGDQPTKKCSNNDACDDNILCLKLLTGPSDGISYGCCEKSFCNETGMISIVSGDDHELQWEWDGDHVEDTHWYNQKMNTFLGACPKPLSFQLLNQPEKALPINFKTGQTSLTTCEKSSDCGPKQFCGHVYNPSFCNKDSISEKYHNKCLDMSNKGKPLKFCYPDPSTENTNIKFKKRINQTELLLCNIHTDCFDYFPTEKMFCLFEPRGFVDLDENGKPTGKTFKGVCVEAAVCRKPIHKDKLATLGRAHDRLAGTICEVGKPETCPGRRVECIAIKVTDEVPNVCCELKLDYETPPKNRNGIIVHRLSPNQTSVDNDVDNENDEDEKEEIYEFNITYYFIGMAIGLAIVGVSSAIFFGVNKFMKNSSAKKKKVPKKTKPVKAAEQPPPVKKQKPKK